MKKFIVASVVALTVVAASARASTTIAQWTFESAAADSAITNVPIPGAGVATANVPAETDVPGGSVANGLHATVATYSIPAGDIDLTLAPSISTSSHSFSSNGWSIGDYYQFKTSTLGFTGVTVGWDQTGSNTGPANFQLSYSLDGTTFTPIGSAYTLVYMSWSATTALGNNESASFAGAVDNKANVYFRIVDTSATSVNGGTVAAAGTGRVDNFTVLGVPEPSTVALVGAGLVGLLALRRRRS